MSAVLSRLMDREKYLLAGMVYFHLPTEMAGRDFEQNPLPLCEQIELIPWCECGSANKKGPDGTDADAMRAEYARYKAVYQVHPELCDLRLTGYINDNAGACATPSACALHANGRKTGFVAMAYRDGDGNGLVVFSGCETQRLRPMVKDYADCIAAAVGCTTAQQRLALAFYDHAMRDVPGERGVIGHSKGGNLATHVFINRLQQPLQAYCINAQPYCWWAMTREQQAALKCDRYEFIAHAGDVVHHAGYVSYVSRIVQMNPYLNRRQLISLHDFSSMEFDGMGNLQGSRVLRATRHTLKSRLFGDASGESAPEGDEVVRRFRALLAQKTEPSRLLSVAMEEACLATGADTALLLLRLPRDSGDILYTCQARGDSALRLRDFRLRVPRGDDLCALLNRGMPVNISDPGRFEAHFQPLENVLGWKVRGADVIPLGGEDSPWFGALELLSRERALSAEEMALAVELGDGLAQLIAALPPQALRRPNSEPLLRLRRGNAVALEVERHAYQELACRFAAQRDAYLRLFRRGRLAGDETLRFEGWDFLPANASGLRNWRRKGVAVVGRARGAVGGCGTVGGHGTVGGRGTPMSAEEAARFMGFPALEEAALTRRARLAGGPLPTGEAEAEVIRARLALCLMRRTPLVVFDTYGCAPDTIREVCAYLHLLCYDKLSTALVLRTEPDASPNEKP